MVASQDFVCVHIGFGLIVDLVLLCFSGVLVCFLLKRVGRLIWY